MIYLWLAATAALLLDRFLGEPRRWHPLVGFGRLASRLELALNRGGGRLWRGVLGVILLVLPLVAAASITQLWLWWFSPWLFVAVAAGVLYLAIGRRSLVEHADAVAHALTAQKLPLAREQVARIVSRDCQQLDEEGVSRATVETVLENGSDAVLASLFWFVIAGLPGVVMHRAVNTLDAMWGYRTPRFAAFGWAAARCDDLLNYLPARLTALTYALVGRAGQALRCWREQARHWSSPNAGPVMAAGAGALGLQLGGRASYHGEWVQRPPLGCGRAPATADISRALQLLNRGVMLWLVAMLAGALWPA